jgi:hypothetical protein
MTGTSAKPPRRAPRALLSAAVLGGVLLLGAPAPAQQQDPAAIEREAQQSFQAGVELANRARWSAAEAAFARSSTLKPVAATWLNLAAVRVRLGRVNGALEALDRLDALPPENIAERQRERAAEVRREALALAAKREIQVAPAHASLRLDGSLISGAGSTRSLLLDPGKHVLTVAADGYVAQEISIDAEPGSEETLELTLAPRPPPPRRPAVKTLTPDPLRPLPGNEKDSSSIWSSPWLWTGIGATAAAVITLVVLAPWSNQAPPDGGSTGDVHRPGN